MMTTMMMIMKYFMRAPVMSAGKEQERQSLLLEGHLPELLPAIKNLRYSINPYKCSAPSLFSENNVILTDSAGHSQN